MNWLNSLSLSQCLALSITFGVAFMWLCVWLKRLARRTKARRRRHLLNRLNHSGYFKTMDSKYYRAGKLQ